MKIILQSNKSNEKKLNKRIFYLKKIHTSKKYLECLKLYLCVVVFGDLMSSVCCATIVLFSGIKCVNNYLFGSFYFCSTERATLGMGCFLLSFGMCIEGFCILTCPSESTCHDVKHGVHSKCPQGSIRISLSFSAHILHS